MNVNFENKIGAAFIAAFLLQAAIVIFLIWAGFKIVTHFFG